MWKYLHIRWSYIYEVLMFVWYNEALFQIWLIWVIGVTLNSLFFWAHSGTYNQSKEYITCLYIFRFPFWRFSTEQLMFRGWNRILWTYHKPKYYGWRDRQGKQHLDDQRLLGPELPVRMGEEREKQKKRTKCLWSEEKWRRRRVLERPTNQGG